MRRPTIFRAFATVGIWTLASRVMGFARDVAIAGALGAGPVAEAFLVAFSLPNMFRRFFAEGAFNMAFVPIFSKKLEGGEGAREFARDAFTGLMVVTALFTLLGMILMPALVFAMASGFAEDERFDLAVLYGRIAFPYIMMISLAALLSGVLNAAGRFVAAAAAPVILNVIFVAAIGIGYLLGAAPLAAFRAAAESARFGDMLALSVPLGGLAQLAIVWVAAARAGFRLIPRRPRMTPELRRLAVIAAPAALAGGVVQVNLLVGRQVASFFDGAVAWLNYADRLYQLPLGVVGIAIGVVLLPDLSRRLRAGDAQGGRDALSRAGEISLALTLPAAVALVVVPLPIVRAMFERGAFGIDDSAATALAVAVYALGLPAFVMQKVLQPLYFARHDTRRPFRYALVSMVVNAALAIGLAPLVGFLAAAIGTTLSGWAMMWLLARGRRGMGEVATLDARFRARLPRILLASAGMGAALWALNLALGPVWSAARPLALLLLVLGGAASYFALAHLLGALRLSDLRGAMRRD